MPNVTPNHEVGLYIFILAGFLGYHVISRVPPLLHTPLMSATNAISGISLIGSLVVVGEMHDWTGIILGFIAVGCSTTNVVGGFLITDRMLAMFKSEREAKSAWWMDCASWPGGARCRRTGPGARPDPSAWWRASSARCFSTAASARTST